MKVIRFTVAGASPFPTELLHHDSCWPADHESAEGIGASGHAAYEDREVNLMSIALYPSELWGKRGWVVTKEGA